VHDPHAADPPLRHRFQPFSAASQQCCSRLRLQRPAPSSWLSQTAQSQSRHPQQRQTRHVAADSNGFEYQLPHIATSAAMCSSICFKGVIVPFASQACRFWRCA